MLEEVRITRQLNKEEFLQFLDAEQRQELIDHARGLAGQRVVHVNATPAGGGVAEILISFIPYLRALEIPGSWYTLNASNLPSDFFAVTDKLRDALQGKPVRVEEDEWRLWEKINQRIASQLDRFPVDILVLHDWQPLPAGVAAHPRIPKIYVSHPDTSSPQPEVWKRILPLMNAYERIFFSNDEFVHRDLPPEKVRVFPPAIDPLSLKQKIIPVREAKKLLSPFGIDPKRPTIVQVSRFDIWKNPLGVIEAFRIVQRSYPNVQLVLVGINTAKDNPEAKKFFDDVAAAANNDPNILLFFEPNGVSDVTVFTMMVQNAADVIVQNSTREGFGMTVTEAMWKKKPVVGGSASGIRRQIINGVNGFIVETSNELAERIIELLGDSKLREKMGRAAQESVRRQFLMSRLVLDHLREYRAIMDR